ncbi:DEAD/DEAH box helicase family protein [uncultured Legionella sp.]|uniref:DEAD/DEAH box helicase family protein n=1 Tax=uncultured Legionella sp. TaxID=210934 RepID=UPI002613C358|nr:DEAD/DEAH box helicase family protein [uncultured Legionella sp.]
MKLHAAGKKKLLNSAKDVYLAFTALDFFKSRTFTTESGNKSIFELCQLALKNKNYAQILLINGIHYKLVLTPGPDNNFSVQLFRAMEATSAVEVKKVNSYMDQEVLNLFASQQFNLEIPKDSEELVLSNRINNQLVIGGPGKIDLYRTHLVTLHNIIEKIEQEGDISNLLVALATGTGKTYVQALWVMTLSLSGHNGVFAVPDKLTKQFARDLKRLLPDSFVDSMFILRENEDKPAAKDALKLLAEKNTSGTIIIGSSEHLLDKHYHDLDKADSNHTFLAFDEQHLIMKAERRRMRLIELSKKKLSMFLTATPNLETYQLSGNKPVAIMSSGQKMEAGQGQFPNLVSFQARNISDRNKLKTWQFWTAEFWKNMFNGLLLRLTNAIQEEQSSAAVSLVDDLLYYHFDKEGETSARWRMQVPAARKMLCIIDDNETLVNFCNVLQNSSYGRRDVYRNGNLVNRADVANFFHLPDAEVAVIEDDLRDKREKYTASLKPDEQQVSITHDLTLAQQVKNTMLHNLIEYVLTDITGLDEIEHNRLRKLNMNEFQQLVISRFQPRTVLYYQQKLAKDIDANGAQIIGGLLADLSLVMQRMINNQSNIDAEENNKDLADFIDNWPLYSRLIEQIKRDDWDFRYAFEDYAKRYLMMGVMQGMKDAETPVAESIPFAGLQQHVNRMYDYDGVLVKDAKKRKHTSLEVLNDTSTESVFSPTYLDISEDTADNYFRLGFVGVYVSNKKTEGFSDRNLHTVINIAEETLSNTNSPDAQIQGIGRNRGLDSTIVPAYIHSLGRGQKTVFKLDHLQSNDYYPELFKAQKEYNNQYVAVLGNQVSKQIIAWIYSNLDDDQTINPDRLKRQVLKFIALALRDINNKNSHQIKLSRAQLADVVHYAMQGIDDELRHLNEPYRLSFFLRALSHTLNFIAECYYTFIRIPVDFKIFYHSWFGPREVNPINAGQKNPDDVYIKILNKKSFKSIISNMSSALEFKNWMGKKSLGFKTHVNKNISKYLKEGTAADYTAHLKLVLEPLLLNLVVDSRKEQVANALLIFPHGVDYLHSHLPLLADLFSHKPEQFETALLSFFHQIPGLGDLQLSDIVNYPEKMEQLLALFSDEPNALLLKSPELRSAFTVRLTHFLQNDFSSKLSAFLIYPDAVAVKSILEKEKQAFLFANHCMTKLVSGELELAAEALFDEFRTFFKLKDLKSLAETGTTIQDSLSALENELRENLVQNLNERTVDQLVGMMQFRLLPLLVNCYPLASRERLLSEASDTVRITNFLKQHASALLSFDSDNATQLAHFVFSNLIEGELPAQINLDEEIEKASEAINQQILDLKNTNVQDFMLGKLLSPASWSLSPQYLYDGVIANMLRSDEFLDSISLLLPYDQWLNLKNDIRHNQVALITIARILIDKQNSDEPVQPSPQEMLDLFNQHLNTHYLSSIEATTQVKEQTQKLWNDILKNPLLKLSTEMKERFVQIGLNQLLPLLASFIKSDVKKAQFLGLKREPELIFNFMVQNEASLRSLMAGKEDELNEELLPLINQLLPEQDKYCADDIHNPIEHANECSEQLKSKFEQLYLSAVLTSDLFLDLLKNSFNAHDFKLATDVLHIEGNINSLVEKMHQHGIEHLNKETLLGFIKTMAPQLHQVDTLDGRLNAFQEFIREVEGNISRNLDKSAISELLTETMLPILFNNKFIQIIDNITGFLNEQDLTVIFDAFGKEQPDFEAQHYQRFISIIRAKDKEALRQEFMYLSGEGQDFDFDQLPAKKMLDTITSLIEEVLDCHCHYNDQDRKGSIGCDHKPKLEGKISSQLSEMIIKSEYGFFGRFSRKGFYIHGLTQGLAAGGEISAESIKHITKVLQRVKSHILRPLWWSSNGSNLMHAFTKGCHDVTQAVVAAWYGAVNGVKSSLNWLTNSNYYIISHKNLDSEDFNETTFYFAEEINQLDPLTAKHVMDKECPVDVVTHLEEFVAKRPARAGFFGGNLGTPVIHSEEKSTPGFKFH